MKKLAKKVPSSIEVGIGRRSLTYRKSSAHYTKKGAEDMKNKLKAQKKLVRVRFRKGNEAYVDLWVVYSRNKK